MEREMIFILIYFKFQLMCHVRWGEESVRESTRNAIPNILCATVLLDLALFTLIALVIINIPTITSK